MDKAAILEARFTILAVPHALSRSRPRTAVKMMVRNIPVPGPKKTIVHTNHETGYSAEHKGERFPPWLGLSKIGVHQHKYSKRWYQEDQEIGKIGGSIECCQVRSIGRTNEGRYDGDPPPTRKLTCLLARYCMVATSVPLAEANLLFPRAVVGGSPTAT